MCEDVVPRVDRGGVGGTEWELGGAHERSSSKSEGRERRRETFRKGKNNNKTRI